MQQRSPATTTSSSSSTTSNTAPSTTATTNNSSNSRASVTNASSIPSSSTSNSSSPRTHPPSTFPLNVHESVDPEDLQSQFKIAANALTQIYKRAWKTSKRDRKTGYMNALQDMWQACEQLSKHPLTLHSGARLYVPLDVVLDTLVQGGIEVQNEMFVEKMESRHRSSPPHFQTPSDVSMSGGMNWRTSSPPIQGWTPPSNQEVKDSNSPWNCFLCTNCGKPIPYDSYSSSNRGTSPWNTSNTSIMATNSEIHICSNCRPPTNSCDLNNDGNASTWGDTVEKGSSHGNGFRWGESPVAWGPNYPMSSGSTTSSTFSMNKKHEGFRKRIREG